MTAGNNGQMAPPMNEPDAFTVPRAPTKKRKRLRSPSRHSIIPDTQDIGSVPTTQSVDHDALERDASCSSRRRMSRADQPLSVNKGKTTFSRLPAARGTVSERHIDKRDFLRDAVPHPERLRASSSSILNSNASNGNNGPLRLPSTSSTALADSFLETLDLNSGSTCSRQSVPISSAPVLPPTPVSISPLPLPLPTSPPGSTTSRPPQSTTSFPGAHLLHLTHHGHPLTYDLTLLADDPTDPIALLGATQSEPGTYFTVGAHYRRTGRSRAARCIIQALLEREMQCENSATEKGENPSEKNHSYSTTTSSPPPSPPVFRPRGIVTPLINPARRSALLRPALLLLAACELDLSRDAQSPEEKNDHAVAAHDLFRAVYGDGDLRGGRATQESVNAGRPVNALGLNFAPKSLGPENQPAGSFAATAKIVSHTPNPHPPRSPSSARCQALENELTQCRVANRNLEVDIIAAKDLQHRNEQELADAKRRARDVEKDLYEVNQNYRDALARLAEAERSAEDMRRTAAGAETRVWGRMRDLLYDQFGGVQGG
ncbi:hypothetical protein BV22DRAFT_1195777 [Leucogyrophana mollusca]|uniref:Uncharacterized protein n=1 Tax=Leucogyrophana mollusca TaxID=85980 RepID=A0ACB8BFP6_9AGAM|nr:hypothetical protein BV22DRAFT_1195777 [Leucogyrophana mollusca]